MNLRDAILHENRAMREKRVSVIGPRKLDDGEVEFRIPKRDWKVLQALFPELVSKDPVERDDAWRAFRHSELGAQYLVGRTPAQVKRSAKRDAGVIIR